MGPYRAECLFAVVLTSAFATPGFASPLGSRLLPLVPPGAEIVAGFQNPHDPTLAGHLLLTTHSNRLDLDDWQALTGVDNKRIFDEAIEVAASPSGGILTEHLLLVGGLFDRERIYAAAEQNGAERTEYQGQPVLLIKPFAREAGDMQVTRWLVILDNRTGIFGTPFMVQKTLIRYANHAVPDSILEERLSQLRPDVGSWNVLVPSPKATRNIRFRQPQSAWARLQEDSEVLMVGARFGPRIRVDFSIHAKTEQNAEFFAQKTALFSDAFEEGSQSHSQPSQRRVENLSVAANRVQGSIAMSRAEFDAWCAQLIRIPAASEPAQLATTRGN